MTTYKKFLVLLCTGLLALNFDIQASQKEKNRDKYAKEDTESDEEDTTQEMITLEEVNTKIIQNLKDPKIYQGIEVFDRVMGVKNCAELIFAYYDTKQCVNTWKVKLPYTGPVEIVAMLPTNTTNKEDIRLSLCDRKSKKELMCLTNDKSFMSLVASKVITLSDFKNVTAKNKSKKTDSQPWDPKNLTLDEFEDNSRDFTKIINLSNDVYAITSSGRFDGVDYENPCHGLFIWDDNKKNYVATYNNVNSGDQARWVSFEDIILLNNIVITISESYIYIFDISKLPTLIPEIIIAYDFKDLYLDQLIAITQDSFLTCDNHGHQCLWKLIPDDLVLTWQEYQRQKLKRIATEVVGSRKKRKKKLDWQVRRPSKKLKTDTSDQE